MNEPTFKISYQGKPPYNTFSIVIEHQVNCLPEPIVKALERLGWKHSIILPPDEKGYSESIMSKKGRGIFNSWTPRQKDKFMKEANEAMAKLGIDVDQIPIVRLTARELL